MQRGYTPNGEFASYANILTYLIESTAIADSIKPTVWKHMQRYRNEYQAEENSDEWRCLGQLLPEVFDPVLRQMLEYLDAQPDWIRRP